ncbi:MAG: hypothetical protein PVG61_02325 [Dehalococcoidia bacterium]|jgi:hypothetical protein
MDREIILYNLADHVTDEEFNDYVKNEKGPLIESLPSVKKYTLVRITKSPTGEIPYEYMGIVDITSIEEFLKTDAQLQKYQDFRAKFQTMVKDLQILFGEEVY